MVRESVVNKISVRYETSDLNHCLPFLIGSLLQQDDRYIEKVDSLSN
ncbi:MAG: hypothetical protein FKGGLIKP_00458 [Sodalis sp. Fse]|nr:MAG: hypothetical protein FKGGLIKP_00458 [Sodalis sp. Fse]